MMFNALYIYTLSNIFRCSLPEVLIQKRYVLLKRLEGEFQDTQEDLESY